MITDNVTGKTKKQLVGSSFDTYLLETSRVVSQKQPGERNFHIFYQILSAPNTVKREILGNDWGGATIDDFAYLALHHLDSNLTNTNHQHDDASLWEETCDALKIFGWEGGSLQRLMRSLCIVLLLGNIRFEEDEDGEAIITGEGDVNILADYLGIPFEEIESALTMRLIYTGREMLCVPQSADQAKAACDALAKAIYAAIFASVVRQVNVLTAVSPVDTGKYRDISLVDIFGFENFEVNRFEQLCINYANERLQQKYIIDNLQRFKCEYEAEGVDVPDWKNIDNSNIIDLLEGSLGLISTLNEQCIRPNGSSEVFVFQFKKANKNKDCLISKKLQLRSEFGICHFAGPVKYDASCFVEHNTDKIPVYSIRLIAAKSSNGLIAHELSDMMKKLHESMARDPIKKKPVSSIDKFSLQLRQLLTSIEDSQTRYIRCIKPCDDFKGIRKFDHHGVIRQIRCAGLVTVIELSRQSFPNRLPFGVVEKRFSCLLPASISRDTALMETHDKVQLMMSILFAPYIEKYKDSDFLMPFACGRTKVFFRSGALEMLEAQRSDCFTEASTKIQRFFRRVIQQENYEVMRNGIIQLQAVYRGRNVEAQYRLEKYSATKIQCIMKITWARRGYLELRRSFRLLRSWLCVIIAQKRLQKKLIAGRRLSNWIRMTNKRSAFLMKVRGIILIQSWWRSNSKKLRYEELRRAQTFLARWWMTYYVRQEFVKRKRAASIMTVNTRAFLSKLKYHRLRKTVVTTQAIHRMKVQRLQYLKLLEAALTIAIWRRATIEHRLKVKKEIALKKLLCWARSRLQLRKFLRKKAAAIRITSWFRGTDQRKKFLLEKAAAIKITSWFRYIIHRRNYKKMVQNALFLSTFWRSRRRRQLKKAADNLLKVQKSIESWSPKMNSSKELGETYSISEETITSIGQPILEVFCQFEEAMSALSSVSDSISTPPQKSKIDASSQTESEVEKTSSSRRANKSQVAAEIKTPKPSGDCVLVPKQVLEDAEQYKRQVDELNHDIMHVTAECALHNQELEAEYEERLAEYEVEVLQLKETLRAHEEEKVTLQDEIAANAENIRNLKNGIRSMQESHREYLNKIMRAIENANAKHEKALKTLEKDRESEVKALKAELVKVRETQMQPVDEINEKRRNNVFRMARKLEKLISPDYITMTAKKATTAGQPLVDFMEEKLSSKARKIIYRMEDVVLQVPSDPKDEACIQGLQQQLVNAYEEIERLQKELSRGRGRSRRRGLR